MYVRHARCDSHHTQRMPSSGLVARLFMHAPQETSDSHGADAPARAGDGGGGCGGGGGGCGSGGGEEASSECMVTSERIATTSCESMLVTGFERAAAAAGGGWFTMMCSTCESLCRRNVESATSTRSGSRTRW